MQHIIKDNSRSHRVIRVWQMLRDRRCLYMNLPFKFLNGNQRPKCIEIYMQRVGLTLRHEAHCVSSFRTMCDFAEKKNSR